MQTMFSPSKILRTNPVEKSTRFLIGNDDRTPVPVVCIAAMLALAVAIIHLQDQGGLLGDQSVLWLKYGYYLIEITTTVTAGLILRGKVVGWIIGSVATTSAMVGYIVSRTVGVPGDPGDIGNWGYTLGTVSLIVEGTFVVIAVLALKNLIRSSRYELELSER